MNIVITKDIVLSVIPQYVTRPAKALSLAIKVEGEGEWRMMVVSSANAEGFWTSLQRFQEVSHLLTVTPATFEEALIRMGAVRD
jgi:hypothetical protein